LIDQGDEDNFLKANQLLPENLAQASKENHLVEVDLRFKNVIKFNLILNQLILNLKFKKGI
jgi:hypothetical protein